MEGEEEWCILRISKHIVVVRLPHVPGDWVVLARGFKSEAEALKYVPLFNEE